MSYDYNDGTHPANANWALPGRVSVTRERNIRRVSVLRDPGYLESLKERPCVACAKAGLPERPLVGAGSLWPWMAVIDPAHTVGNGMRSKGPDSSCIPLCRYHHDEMDGRLSTRVTTKAQFALKYDLDLAEESAAHYARYLLTKEKNGTA